MAITNDSKEKLKSRLSRAIGHLNAVHRMVEEKKYCIDILNQLKAVQAATDKTAEMILRQHIETCVVEAVKQNDSSRVISELITIFRKDGNDGSNRKEQSTFAESESGERPAKLNSDNCCH